MATTIGLVVTGKAKAEPKPKEEKASEAKAEPKPEAPTEADKPAE